MKDEDLRSRNRGSTQEKGGEKLPGPRKPVINMSMPTL
jgi:hypothetical protein